MINYLLASVFVLILTGDSFAESVHAATLSPKDKLFIKYAASANLLEIQSGQMAQGKAVSPTVKELARRMVIEHARSKDELALIAAAKNLKLPGQVERRQRPVLVDLQQRGTGEFDKAYLDAVRQNHEKLRGRLKWAIRNLKDQELKAWAVKTLPIVEQHLEMWYRSAHGQTGAVP